MIGNLPNIRHLRAFFEVARCHGISAAANKVFLSQPAITQAISKLERQLEVRLFDRMPQGMELTQAGQIYFRRVELMLSQLRLGVQDANLAQSARNLAKMTALDRKISAVQMRALMALSKARNFTIAAQNIGISQPSLYRAARDLERVAGIAMFHKTRYGITLSEAARKLSRRVFLATGELMQGASEIKTYLGQDTSELVIGSMPLARTRMLPKAAVVMLKAAPDIKLRTIEGPYSELLRGLRQGEIDFLIGALRQPAPINDIVQQALFVDDLALVVRAGHPMCGRFDLSLDTVFSYPWIAPPASTPTGEYLKSVLNIYARTNSPVRVISSSLVLVRGVLLEADYVTLISRQQVRYELDAGLLETLDIELADSARTIGLTFREDWIPTSTQAQFLAVIRDICRQENTVLCEN